MAYIFHTIGELCASPVALSFVTKLAPPNTSLLCMMGVYYAATSLGNRVAVMSVESSELVVIKWGCVFLAEMWERFNHYDIGGDVGYNGTNDRCLNACD